MPIYILINDELYHHGIKGMKWGVRRYQNKDGSLTAAGRKRLNTKQARATYKSEKKKAKSSYWTREQSIAEKFDSVQAKYDKGHMSRMDLEKANSKATKKIS